MGRNTFHTNPNAVSGNTIGYNQNEKPFLRSTYASTNFKTARYKYRFAFGAEAFAYRLSTFDITPHPYPFALSTKKLVWKRLNS